MVVARASADPVGLCEPAVDGRRTLHGPRNPEQPEAVDAGALLRLFDQGTRRNLSVLQSESADAVRTREGFVAASRSAERLLRRTLAPCYPSFFKHLPAIIEALKMAVTTVTPTTRQ